MDMVFEEDELLLDGFRKMAADGHISKDFCQNLMNIVFECDITQSMLKDEATNFPEAEWSNFFIEDDYYSDEYLYLEEKIMARNKLNEDREYRNYLRDRTERTEIRNHENIIYIVPTGDQNRKKKFAEGTTIQNSNNKKSTKSFVASADKLTFGDELVVTNDKSSDINSFVNKEKEKKTILNYKNGGKKGDENLLRENNSKRRNKNNYLGDHEAESNDRTSYDNILFVKREKEKKKILNNKNRGKKNDKNFFHENKNNKINANNYMASHEVAFYETQSYNKYLFIKKENLIKNEKVTTTSNFKTANGGAICSVFAESVAQKDQNYFED